MVAQTGPHSCQKGGCFRVIVNPAFQLPLCRQLKPHKTVHFVWLVYPSNLFSLSFAADLNSIVPQKILGTKTPNCISLESPKSLTRTGLNNWINNKAWLMNDFLMLSATCLGILVHINNSGDKAFLLVSSQIFFVAKNLFTKVILNQWT